MWLHEASSFPARSTICCGPSTGDKALACPVLPRASPSVWALVLSCGQRNAE